MAGWWAHGAESMAGWWGRGRGYWLIESHGWCVIDGRWAGPDGKVQIRMAARWPPLTVTFFFQKQFSAIWWRLFCFSFSFLLLFFDSRIFQTHTHTNTHLKKSIKINNVMIIINSDRIQRENVDKRRKREGETADWQCTAFHCCQTLKTRKKNEILKQTKAATWEPPRNGINK